MGLIHFPVALTEEEEILKQTLARLKKKKKQLQSLKAAAANQEKETNHHKSSSKPAQNTSMDSADKATEQAKKLVQSGAIKVMGQKERSGFKRSKTFEKKKDTDKPAPAVGFQPFAAFSGDEDNKPPPSKRVKSLKESFISAGFGHRGGGYDRPERESEHREPPKKGNTIYVHGLGIMEDFICKAFSNFGKIVNINMEADKNTAFVTFERMEAADQAIAQVNGSIINNIQLNVQMARRQLQLETLATGEQPSSQVWTCIAANNSQKGPSHRDKRDMQVYDTDMF